MHQASNVTPTLEDRQSPQEGATSAKPTTTESKPRKRVSLRQASLESAVRLLCSLMSQWEDDERLKSYAKDGF